MNNSIPTHHSSNSDLINPHFGEAAERALHPPHFFQAHSIDHIAIANRSLREAVRLYPELDLSANSANLPQRVRDLLGRARFHQKMAEEEETQHPAAELTTHSIYEEGAQHNPSIIQTPTLVPPVQSTPNPELSPSTPQTPHSLSTNQSKIAKKFQRLKQQRLQKAAHHEKEAATYTREANYTARFVQTMKEAGPQYAKDVEKAEAYVQQRRAKVAYHTMRARYWEDLAYGNDTSSPGAYHQMPVGNYQDEYRVKAVNTPAVEAKDISISAQDLSYVAKTKAHPIAEAIPLKTVKQVSSSQTKSPSRTKLQQASKVSYTEVTAEVPRKINIPFAKASPNTSP